MGHVRCMRKGREEGLLGVCSCCCFLDLLFIRPLVGLNLNGIYGGHVLHYAAKRGIGSDWDSGDCRGVQTRTLVAFFIPYWYIHTPQWFLNICRIIVQKKHQLRFVQCLCVSLNLFGSRSLFSIINPFRQAGDIFHIRSCRRRKKRPCFQATFQAVLALGGTAWHLTCSGLHKDCSYGNIGFRYGVAWVHALGNPIDLCRV